MNLEAIYPENVRDALYTFGIPKDILFATPDWIITQIVLVLLDINW